MGTRSAMSVVERGDRVFDVASESSSRTYIVSWGTEGNFYACTCTAYAIGRNRAGGLGFPFECKHVRAVLSGVGVTRLSRPEPVVVDTVAAHKARLNEAVEALAELLNNPGDASPSTVTRWLVRYQELRAEAEALAGDTAAADNTLELLGHQVAKLATGAS